MAKTLGEIDAAVRQAAAEAEAIMEASPFSADLQEVRQAAATNSFTDDTRRKLAGILGMAEAGFKAMSGDLLAVAHSPSAARAYADRMEYDPGKVSYEHFIAGTLPIRVCYDERHRAISAEYPDRATGRLAIDNMLLSNVELRGDAAPIAAEDWESRVDTLLGEWQRKRDADQP
jgi:hypothetical protein